MSDRSSELTILATPRYKPADEEAHEIDRWGYTETGPLSEIEFHGLTDAQAALLREFVPYAVDEVGGFADFRETAAKTNSLIDRLEALMLPSSMIKGSPS